MFQSTRPRGARQRPTGERPVGRVFQSTRPRGARHGFCVCGHEWHAQFQSTRPRGARLRGSASPSHDPHVSIHAPARGATRASAHACFRHSLFQSTRPRGARRTILRLFCQIFIVSIHAPARGATTAFLGAWKWHGVSIHAPARGATRLARRRGQSWRFQSTRPRGARPPDDGHPIY